MRLKKCRVQNYRSIIDSGEFELENLKTILVGPNEAGKTVLLKALQQLSKPPDVDGFDVLRDYPRAKYNDITTGKIDPSKVTVVTGFFELEDADKELIPEEFHDCQYKLWRNIDNEGFHGLVDAPEKVSYGDLKKSLTRMSAHMDKQFSKESPATETVGYDLASSLFSQQRNLILEGITDYWYIEATAELLKESGLCVLNEKIALVFANSAGKVVYYATILHAHNLKVAALLDSDSAGDQAAQQENLVHALGNKNIMRTKDFYDDVSSPEIEDLLRETLILIVKDEFGVDTTTTAQQQSKRPIIDLFASEVANFSKYKLAKAYVRWTRCHEAKELTEDELGLWEKLIDKINKTLK